MTHLEKDFVACIASVSARVRRESWGESKKKRNEGEGEGSAITRLETLATHAKDFVTSQTKGKMALSFLKGEPRECDSSLRPQLSGTLVFCIPSFAGVKKTLLLTL